tara:strand:- start:31645 stop:32067 length:423 start_codon:yes stop_codon:yes gene_type:complete
MKYYTCEYCFNEFEPTRRRVQKYCSDTCRSKAYYARQTSKDQNELVKVADQAANTKIDTMSLAGIGNATAGKLLADGLKSTFTPEDNKPATKGDLKKLKELIIPRYHKINNLPAQNGLPPHFDLESNEVVYLRFPPFREL